MKPCETEKIVIRLPHELYHRLRNQAYQHNLSLSDFVRQRIELKSTKGNQSDNLEGLAGLSVKEMLARTEPDDLHLDDRLDFFCG